MVDRARCRTNPMSSRALSLSALQDKLVIEHLLWRLFHIGSNITLSQEKIEEATGELDVLKAGLRKEEDKTKAVKKEQAAVNLKVKDQEGRVKKAGKTLEEKVRLNSLCRMVGEKLKGNSADPLFLICLSETRPSRIRH